MKNGSGTENKKHTKAGIIITITGLVIMLIFSPLLSLVFNAGSAVGMSLGLAATLTGLFFGRISTLAKRVWRILPARLLLSAILAIITAFVLLMGITLIKMIKTAEYDGTECGTVIVLGCGLREDGTPSTSLTLRLETAISYLSEHPDCICILSGGKGEDEPFSEASAMLTYLTDRGIAPERLITEEKSANTKENLAYSSQIIREKGLSESVIIITSDFHQYRAASFARENGLEPHGFSAPSALFSAPTYWLRELCGVCFYTVFGWE